MGNARVRRSIRTLAAWLAAASVVAVPRPVTAQDSLPAARDLYTAAAYEDALAVLNRLRTTARHADERRSIEQYRAFCLLALGSNAEAESAIEAVVRTAPLYQPSDADASPRVRSAFADVRHRILPGLIQQRYNEAKAAYDHQDFTVARATFKQVLDLIADPDLKKEAGVPPLSELRTLAAGFHDLSASAAAAAAPAPRPAAPAPRPAAAAVPARSRVPRIYSAEDDNVLPPVAIRQSVASLSDVFALRSGVLEIVIDEFGDVEAATMKTSVNPVYDRLALATARTWRYRPALVDGTPVKFRKIVPIDVKSSR